MAVRIEFIVFLKTSSTHVKGETLLSNPGAGFRDGGYWEAAVPMGSFTAGKGRRNEKQLKHHSFTNRKSGFESRIANQKKRIEREGIEICFGH